MQTAEQVAWSEGTWTTPPPESAADGPDLVVTAAEGSDFWEKTAYGFRHTDGHALLAPWPLGRAVEVAFALDGFTELYDQAGLMLRHGEEQWVKAGVELNDSVPHLGAVVTDGYSDWSLSPVPDWTGQVVTVRASLFADAVIIRARTDEHPWRTIRVARFAHDGPVEAGPFLCAPTRAGFRARFTSWTTTPPDESLHTDPPA